MFFLRVAIGDMLRLSFVLEMDRRVNTDYNLIYCQY